MSPNMRTAPVVEINGGRPSYAPEGVKHGNGSTVPCPAPEFPAVAVELERVIYAEGYAAGLAAGRAEVSCQHVHPAVSESVALMFAGWDGAGAALARSVSRVRGSKSGVSA